MTKVAEQWIEQLAELSAEDRVEIAYRLLDTLNDHADGEWENAWIVELKRREEQIQRGEARYVPAQDAIDELRRKLS